MVTDVGKRVVYQMLIAESQELWVVARGPVDDDFVLVLENCVALMKQSLTRRQERKTNADDNLSCGAV